MMLALHRLGSDAIGYPLRQGRSRVYCDSEENDSDEGLNLLLPFPPKSLLAVFEVSESGRCCLLNLGAAKIWVGGFRLECHNALEIKPGQLITIHSVRYRYRLQLDWEAPHPLGIWTTPSHTLETNEVLDWIRFFGHGILVDVRSELGGSNDRLAIESFMTFTIASRDRYTSLSFSAKFERPAEYDMQQSMILHELLELADLGQMSFSCLRAALGFDEDSLFKLLSEYFYSSRGGGAPSLSDILARALQRLPALAAAQDLLDFVIEPAVCLMRTNQSEKIDGSAKDKYSKILTKILSVDGNADLSHTTSVLESMYLLLVKHIFASSPWWVADDTSSIVERFLADLSDLVDWRTTRRLIPGKSSCGASPSTPSTQCPRTSFSSPSPSPSPCNTTHEKSSPLPSPCLTELQSPSLSLLSELLIVNDWMIKVIFMVYNAMQSKQETGHPPSGRPPPTAEMSFGTFYLLVSDMGLSPYFPLTDLRRIAAQAKSMSRPALPPGSPAQYPEQLRRTKPSFASPTRSSAKKQTTTRPTPTTFSWGTSLTQAELLHCFGLMGEDPRVKNGHAHGIFGLMNDSGAGLKLGLLSTTPLFSVQNQRSEFCRRRSDPSPLRSPHRTPRYQSPIRGNPRQSPNAPGMYQVKRRLLF